MSERAELINRMMTWLEKRIDADLTSDHVPEDEITRRIAALTNLYALQQASVRMARTQKMMDDVRDEFAGDDAYVRECRDADLDIPSDAEHCVTITQKLRRKIAVAAGNS